MKKTPNFTKIIFAALLVVSVKFAACEQEDNDFYIDCRFCLDTIPVWDTMWVSVTINEENPFVPLKFYVGNYENGAIDWVDTAYEETFWLLSEVGTEYSAKAFYMKNSKPLVAVDGDKLRLVDGAGDCYSPCYYVRGGTLDLRLK